MQPFQFILTFTGRLFGQRLTFGRTHSETFPNEMDLPLIDAKVGSQSDCRLKPRTTPSRLFLDFFTGPERASAVFIEARQALQEATVQYADEDEYSDDGEQTEDENDRRGFEARRAITRKEIEDSVLETLHPGLELQRTCHVTKCQEDSFHHVVFVHVKMVEQSEQQHVLKIPAHGTPVHWEDGDGYMLRNEALLMQHIGHILMKELPGKSALDFWFDKAHKDLPDGQSYIEADDPSPELEQKRVVFLKSLAHAMSHLQTLKFKRIGMPVFKEPEDQNPTKIGRIWRWHSTSYMQELESIGPFPSEGFYFHYGLSEVWSMDQIADRDPNSGGVSESKGIRAILCIILSAAPFTKPAPPSNDDQAQPPAPRKDFVLRHDDLNLQNILVDDNGNVTSIIDWDACHSVAACVGYASLPLFLRGDWLFNHSVVQYPYMTWSLNRYCNVYADAMKEACQTPDGSPSNAQCTRKSAMYQALLAVFFDGEDCRQVIGKLLAEIEEFRYVNVKQFCARLGMGWPAAEKALEEKIVELLAPEVYEQ